MAMTEAALMGVDLGTSSAKVVIIDEDGNVLAQASSKYPISTPAPNWAEQDPESWWSAVKEAIRAALNILGPRRILAVGFSGQMHGTVILGKDFKPLRPAIIWADSRSERQCRKIYELVGKKRVLEIACNRAMPGFMAPSLLWIRENEPEIFKKIHQILLPKDYIRFRLTDSIATDYSDASSTLLFNVRDRRWSRELISAIGLEEEYFPEVRESVEIVGEASDKAAEETGLKPGTLVATGGGDSPVGAVGCGLIEPGAVSSNIGSAGQVFTTVDEPKVDPRYRINTFCHASPGKWCIQGSILSAGLALSWFIEGLGFKELLKDGDAYEVLLREAESIKPGSNGLIFLPYLIGERSPHMDPYARGVFLGLTLTHGRQHIVRSIMEGVTYALRDCLEIFKELGVKVERIIARGGGSRSRLWRQIQADIFNARVSTVRVREEAAFGAALLAGVGAGVYRDLHEAVERAVRIEETVDPDPDHVKVYERYYLEIYRKLYPALRDYFRLIADILQRSHD